MSTAERELRLYKTRKAAESNAQKLTAEFSQCGIPANWIAIRKANGWFTVTKVGA